jgi:SsrA-binding protein
MLSNVCINSKAGRDYLLEERFEAGLVLLGSEVKSLRSGQASLNESFALVRDGEVFLVNSYIAPYHGANRFNHDPRRDRKLLLKKREINKLIGRSKLRGYTLVPVRVYFKDGWAKLELAIGKGKRSYDKRDDIKRRDAHMEMSKALKRNLR